jgi:hypothetical protein
MTNSALGIAGNEIFGEARTHVHPLFLCRLHNRRTSFSCNITIDTVSRVYKLHNKLAPTLCKIPLKSISKNGIIYISNEREERKNMETISIDEIGRVLDEMVNNGATLEDMDKYLKSIGY